MNSNTNSPTVPVLLDHLRGHHRPSLLQRAGVLLFASTLIILSLVFPILLGFDIRNDIDVAPFIIGTTALVIFIAAFLAYNVTGQYFDFHTDHIHIHINHIEDYNISHNDVVDLVITSSQMTPGLYSLHGMLITTKSGRQYLLTLTTSMRSCIRSLRVRE